MSYGSARCSIGHSSANNR
ncbi:hypothetical protein AVEN_188805-1, partial [Araneus ventricosus]